MGLCHPKGITASFAERGEGALYSATRLWLETQLARQAAQAAKVAAFFCR